MKNVENIYPLSPMQQGMLLHTVYGSTPGVYLEQFNCILSGDLDVAKFKRTWEKIVARYPVLRSAFVWKGLDEPLQVVRQQVSLPWYEADWSEISPDEQGERLDAYLQKDRTRGFEPTKAPLIRVAVIRLSADAHQMVLTFDHLLLDGWSLALVLKEVFAVYRADCRGEELHLESSRPYSDYIAWLQRQDMNQAEQFWRRTLSGFTAPTPLVVDHSPETALAVQDGFDEYFIQLSEDTTSELRSLMREHQLTLNTLVQGMWALLLSRYGGQDDVVFGAIVSGRPSDLADVERMVGLFINTLPVRVHVQRERQVLSWLQELQDHQAEAREYEYSPLVQVQGWSDVPRGLNLFDSVLSYQNYRVDESAGGDGRSLDVQEVRSKQRPAYPLNIKIMPGKRLALRFVYDPRRFSVNAITRIATHLRNLLENVVTHANQALGTLSLTTTSELEQILVHWNDTAKAHSGNQCIHHLFEAQVERTPDAVAIRYDGKYLTYRDLNSRANQLAHYLIALGVRQETLVGLCLDRSPELIIGMLAVLKAGGAYVPLDPTYPLERLAFMLADAELPILLTKENLIDRLPSTWAHLMIVDAEWDEIAQQSDQNPAHNVTVDNLAYVIYTSGSTGKPKGVLVSHRGIENLVEVQRTAFGINSASRVLQFAASSFDASVSEIFVTLAAGATLCLNAPESMLPGQTLRQLLEEQSITSVTLPPSVLATTRCDGLADLNSIVSAGEACAPGIIEHWGNGRRFINAYGPTENTVCATMAADLPPGRSGLIGRPISNVQVYIVDDHFEPVPVGVAGELLIGGIGLARGYLNRPDLTAERFIPNPFSPEKSARLYRTGDRVRYQEDGNLEFLGRVDHQVKVRGFRIELGEIEDVLARCTGIRDTLVTVREAEPGDQRLVAYVIADPHNSPTAGELRSELKEELPEYMVPSTIVFLDAFPLTPNGKVDRQALPAPDGTRPDLGNEYAAPRNYVEETLASVWCEVLRVKKVGIHDNFFELGGHSLLAAQVISNVDEILNVELSIRSFFDMPTIAQLAESVLDQQRPAEPVLPLDTAPSSDDTPDPMSSLVAIQRAGSKPPFFCVHPSGGNVFSLFELARRLGNDRPFYGLQAKGLTKGCSPHTRIEEMAAFYIEALRLVQPEGPYLLGGWSMGAIVAFEMAQQIEALGQSVSLLALIDSRAPLGGNHIDQETILSSFALDLALSVENPRFSWKQFWQLRASDKLVFVLEQAKEAQLVSASFELSNVQRLVNVFEANVRAMASYKPRNYPGRITLFNAGEPSDKEQSDPTKGWNLLAAEVEAQFIPGNHYTMLREPHVKVLASLLSASLDQANDRLTNRNSREMEVLEIARLHCAAQL